jgi:hypothetical protein
MHLRELRSLPSRLSGSLVIPDSVEILGFHACFAYDCPFTLVFERDSRLTELEVLDEDAQSFDDCLVFLDDHRSRVFVRASARSLKRFRLNLEFARNE